MFTVAAARYSSGTMSMMQFTTPIPVVLVSDPTQAGYAIYVTNGGTWENDVWCVVLCDGGHIRHYRSDQIRAYNNATFEVTTTP